MKFLWVVLSLTFVTFAVALTDEEKKHLEKNRECVKDVGVDEAVIQHLRQGDFSNGDEAHQRFVFCIFRKNNVVTSDGKFNKEGALSNIPRDGNRARAEAAVSACMHERGATPHESAWKMAKCYHEKNPDHVYV